MQEPRPADNKRQPRTKATAGKHPSQYDLTSQVQVPRDGCAGASPIPRPSSPDRGAFRADRATIEKAGNQQMRRYILTGTPGAGKTSVLRLLESLGYSVIEEAATAVIALEQARSEGEPWTRTNFIDKIVALQRRRQMQAATADDIQFYDRSPICTHALSRYADSPTSTALAAEIDRITREQVYQREVFFIRNIGFCEPTAARRISFADSLRFERIHEETYRAFGYRLIDIPASPLAQRVAAIRKLVGQPPDRRTPDYLGCSWPGQGGT